MWAKVNHFLPRPGNMVEYMDGGFIRTGRVIKIEPIVKRIKSHDCILKARVGFGFDLNRHVHPDSEITRVFILDKMTQKLKASPLIAISAILPPLYLPFTRKSFEDQDNPFEGKEDLIIDLIKRTFKDRAFSVDDVVFLVTRRLANKKVDIHTRDTVTEKDIKAQDYLLRESRHFLLMHWRIFDPLNHDTFRVLDKEDVEMRNIFYDHLQSNDKIRDFVDKCELILDWFNKHPDSNVYNTLKEEFMKRPELTTYLNIIILRSKLNWFHPYFSNEVEKLMTQLDVKRNKKGAYELMKRLDLNPDISSEFQRGPVPGSTTSSVLGVTKEIDTAAQEDMKARVIALIDKYRDFHPSDTFRKDLTHLRCNSFESSGLSYPSYSMSIEKVGKGFKFYVHIKDLTPYIDEDMENTFKARCKSIILTHKKYFMIPPIVRKSLGIPPRSEIQRTITIEMTICNETGEVLESDIYLSKIKGTYIHSHKNDDNSLRAIESAKKLYDALSKSQSPRKVKPRILLRSRKNPPETLINPERTHIFEDFISQICGKIVGEYLHAQNAHLYYESLESINSISLTPFKNSEGSVNCFAPVTDPLDSFIDIVTQRQLVSILTQGAINPFSEAYIDTFWLPLSLDLQNSRDLELESDLFWKMKFLRTKDNYIWDAKVLSIMQPLGLAINSRGIYLRIKIHVRELGLDTYLSTTKPLRLNLGQEIVVKSVVLENVVIWDLYKSSPLESV